MVYLELLINAGDTDKEYLMETFNFKTLDEAERAVEFLTKAMESFPKDE